MFYFINLQSQSILNTPPSILAFMPAGRTQWIGDPPWFDSEDKRAKPTYASQERHLNLWSTPQMDISGVCDEHTLEFAALPDRKDKDNAPSGAERCVQFLLIHRQRGPNTLNVTGKTWSHASTTETDSCGQNLTLALASDTFSWLLLFIRKNRASRRM